MPSYNIQKAKTYIQTNLADLVRSFFVSLNLQLTLMCSHWITSSSFAASQDIHCLPIAMPFPLDQFCSTALMVRFCEGKCELSHLELVAKGVVGVHRSSAHTSFPPSGYNTQRFVFLSPRLIPALNKTSRQKPYTHCLTDSSNMY